MNHRRPSNIFSQIKVRHQLYIIFFIGIFIPALALGNYLIYNSRTLLLSHYQDLARADNNQARSILYDLTSNIYLKATTVGEDEKLKKLLCTYYTSESVAHQAVTFFEGFSLPFVNDAYIHNIDIYTFNPTLPEGSHIHPITDEIKETDWFQKMAGSVTPFWANGISVDSVRQESTALCLYTRIFLSSNNYAILKLTLDNNQLRNRLNNCTQETIIWLNGEDAFFSSNYRDSTLPSCPSIAAGSYYLGDVTVNDARAIGCISSLLPSYSDDNFYIASINTDGYPYLNRITAVYIAILLVILLSTSGFVLLFSRHFGKRVNRLRQTMYNVSQGQYDHIQDDSNSEDEISQAFRDLNLMVQNILHKEASVYEAELKNKELLNQQAQMRFEMLSSQINPHFLYNTLETIRMRALAGGNREVANAVKLLGKSMRYALDNSSTSITSLSEELAQIDTYLAIQKLRFHDKINYSLRIPFQMDTGRYQIMPFLIQPLVENAVLHGLRDAEEHGLLIIHIFEENKTLTIKVFDNGCGMTDEELSAMRENIYHHPKDSSKSIGLYNVYQRIQLRYGSAYGLQVKSRKNVGTVFTMTIPALEYKEGGNQT